MCCPICYGWGGDVALGWTHICLGRDRSMGVQLRFGVGAGGVEWVMGVHKLCVCALMMAVSHKLCTAVLSAINTP